MDNYFVYESHLGGIYLRLNELDYDDLYCETCGDSDTLVGVVTCYDEFRDLFPYADRDYLISKWMHILQIEETYGRADNE